LKCGFPERYAQQALGHNSKAVHRAYAKHAEVTVPSLADWEKDWQEKPQRGVQPKPLTVDFRSAVPATAQSKWPILHAELSDWLGISLLKSFH